MRILGIAGSLRAGSSNSSVIQAAAMVAPPGIEVAIYQGLGDLPLFNPDLDVEPGPAAVRSLRAQLQASDAVMICSPEYAHGVPGVLKNALDWVVGSGEFSGKPVALINSSPRATHAQAALTEIIITMDAKVVPEASIDLVIPSRSADAAAILAVSELADAMRAAIIALRTAVEARQADPQT